MVETQQPQSGTYRCPVCGHRDLAELPADATTHVIVCSYCETSLEVTSRGSDSMRLSVQVAKGQPSR